VKAPRLALLPRFFAVAAAASIPLIAVNRIDAVAENLHFDMACVANELFQVEPAIPKAALASAAA